MIWQSILLMYLAGLTVTYHLARHYLPYPRLNYNHDRSEHREVVCVSSVLAISWPILVGIILTILVFIGTYFALWKGYLIRYPYRGVRYLIGKFKK